MVGASLNDGVVGVCVSGVSEGDDVGDSATGARDIVPDVNVTVVVVAMVAVTLVAVTAVVVAMVLLTVGAFEGPPVVVCASVGMSVGAVVVGALDGLVGMDVGLSVPVAVVLVNVCVVNVRVVNVLVVVVSVADVNVLDV